MLCKKDTSVSICTDTAFSAVGTSLVQAEREEALERIHLLCDTSLLSSESRDSMLPSIFLATLDDDNDLHGIDLISVASPRPSG